jgi:hypothetical protein
MGGLEDILFGRQPADSFLRLFPPVNIQASPPSSSSSSSPWHILDFEGFVFLLHPTNDYSKIKTPIYYIAHKFRASNIAEIMSLADGSPTPLRPRALLFFQATHSSGGQMLPTKSFLVFEMSRWTILAPSSVLCCIF